MPRHNGDDSGGREYGDCGLRSFEARIRADQTKRIVTWLREWQDDWNEGALVPPPADCVAAHFNPEAES